MSILQKKYVAIWFSRWLPLAVWAALIFAVSSRPSLPSIGAGHGLPISKIGHFAEYAVLAFLLFRAFSGGKATTGLLVKIALLCLALSVLYGLSDEFHQSFVPNRDASLDDVAIDGGGAAVGLLVAAAWLRWRVRARG